MSVEGCNELLYLIEDFMMPAYNYLNFYLGEVINNTLEQQEDIITSVCAVFMIAVVLLYLWWILKVLESLNKEVFVTESVLGLIPISVLQQYDSIRRFVQNKLVRFL